MLEWQPNAEGIFYDLPAETYQQAPGVSHSMVKNMRPTPAHLQAYLAEKREPTPAMILGTLVHHAILEPDRPFPQLAVKPEGMKFSTKEGKAWRDAQEQAGKLIITQADYDALVGIVLSVAAHPVCRQIFAQGEREVSLFKTFEHDAGACLRKCRIDFMPFGNSLIDIKTTTDASPAAFAKTIHEMRYFTQAAYYLDLANDSGAAKECFLFVAVEKTPPYLVAVYNLDREAISKGRDENFAALLTYIQCSERNEWPGYPKQIANIGLPAWANRKTSLW